MACTLTSGRTNPCKDAIGGMKAAYLIDYQEDAFTVSGGTATAIDAGVTVCYKYELLADGNTLVETIASDENTGTSTYTQALTMALKKQTKESAAELKLMVAARPIVVVQLRSGEYKIVGLEDGCTTTGTIESGGAKGEFNGYNITMTAIETQPAPTLDSATVTALLALVSGTNVTP